MLLYSNQKIFVGVRRLVWLSNTSQRVQTLRALSTTVPSTTAAPTKPEDVIAECARIRESIQALNDVSQYLIDLFLLLLPAGE